MKKLVRHGLKSLRRLTKAEAIRRAKKFGDDFMHHYRAVKAEKEARRG